MNKYHTSFLNILLLALLILLIPATSLAGFDASAHKRDYINRWAARVEKQIARLMDRYCEQFVRYQEKYGSNLPGFCEDESVDPEPTPSPSPSPSISSSPSPTPSESPSPTPTPSPSPSPSPSSSPSPTTAPTSSIVLSEIYYDVDAAHGAETTNEWVEIRNSTDTAVDVSGYMLTDATTNDVLPAGTIVPANGYLLITDESSTITFWTIPAGSPVVVLGSAIGNALGNSGDVLRLKDAGGIELDAVSWGNNVSAFDPAVPVVAEGSSISRISGGADTDTAADWVTLTTPTPGE